jgi:hypothetical protein
MKDKSTHRWKKQIQKNILLSLVFAQGNMNVPNYILNTTNLASNTAKTNHITSTAAKAGQVWKHRLKKNN